MDIIRWPKTSEVPHNNSQKPPPVDSKYYTKKYFKKFLKNKGANLNYSPVYKRIIQLAKIKPGMRVLDLGCGRGELIIYAARLGARVKGIDYAQTAIKMAQKSIATQPKYIQSRINLKKTNVKNLYPRQNYYDRIFMVDLIEHLRSWEVDILLPKIRASLKQSGCLVIHTFPNRLVADYGFYLYKIWHYLARGKPPIEKNRDPNYDLVMHINEQTPYSLKKTLRKHRFSFRVWLEEGDFYLMLKSFGAKKSHLKRYIVKLLGLWPFKLLFFNRIYVIARKKDLDNK